MQTYKSIIAYDGTEFKGFQRQADGVRTVQGELENALRVIGWSESSLKAAGRTDAGVHARGQVISFCLEWRDDLESLSKALNANLPFDISVGQTEIVAKEFHPRFSARRREYQYSLYSGPFRAPLRDRYSWRVWPEPDVERLNLAAECLIGRRDFAAFGQAPIEGGHTIREVIEAEWLLSEGDLIFTIVADAFLYHMVRRVTAAMISFGTGRGELYDFKKTLEDPTRGWQGAIAPPNGLSLEAVYYT